MATYGLGNFLYDVTSNGKDVVYRFYDPEDASNTAEVTVAASEYPEGVSQHDSRQVADVAYAKVQEQLERKRDDRLREQADRERAKADAEDQRQRSEAKQYLDNVTELADHPNKGEEPKAPQQSNKNDKKK